MSFYVSTATFFLLHCDEWDRVVALPRHKFVTGATLLQLDRTLWCFWLPIPPFFLTSIFFSCTQHFATFYVSLYHIYTKKKQSNSSFYPYWVSDMHKVLKYMAFFTFSNQRPMMSLTYTSNDAHPLGNVLKQWWRREKTRFQMTGSWWQKCLCIL